jgi:CRP/FNR family cyclic AMP-dependent transcriptional regulator
MGAFLASTWLKGLDAHEVEAAAAVAAARRYDDGNRVIDEGEEARAFFIVRRGHLRFTRLDAHGNEMLLTVLAAGDTFGEVSILGEARRTHICHCVGETELVEIPAAAFLALFEARPLLRRHIVKRLCELVHTSFDAIKDQLLLEPRARLAKRLLELAATHGKPGPDGVAVDAHLSQSDLANMIGASRQTVGDVLTQWRRKGWIVTRYNAFTLCDAKALEAVARAE